MPRAVIDLHSHILPGLDDGAASLAESRELARRMVADGVPTVVATPHVRFDYPTAAATMEEAVAAVRTDLAEHGIGLEVLPGGEIGLDRIGALDDDELRRFTLAQTGVYVLLEFPYVAWPLPLPHVLATLGARDIVTVLGHPERNPEVQRAPERLARAVEAGALVQVTAASLDGRFGRGPRATSERLLDDGLVHVVASDAHGPSLREAGLRAAVDAIGDAGLARYLTEEAPAAIVAGEPVGAPAPRRRSRFRRLRRS